LGWRSIFADGPSLVHPLGRLSPPRQPTGVGSNERTVQIHSRGQFSQSRGGIRLISLYDYTLPSFKLRESITVPNEHRPMVLLSPSLPHAWLIRLPHDPTILTGNAAGNHFLRKGSARIYFRGFTPRISKHSFPPSSPAEMAIPEWTIGDFVHRGPWWKNRGKHAALPC
jgi:hypothetical protein